MKAYKTGDLVINETKTIETDGIATDVEYSVFECVFLDDTGEESENGFLIEKETYTTLPDFTRKTTSVSKAISEDDWKDNIFRFVESILGE